MTKPTDQEIEHVARAMCEAHGKDPETWLTLRIDAINFLAAYRAMQEWH